MAEKLADRWQTRDFPVLLEIARRLDAGDHLIDSRNVATTLDLDPADVAQAYEALMPTYIVGKAHRAMGHGAFLGAATGLTDRGRRATGLWPDEDATTDALVDLLTKAADHIDDDEDAGALRRAGRLLKNVPSAVITDVTMALIRQQTGLP